MAKLTKALIAEQIARSKPYYVWDTHMIGFGLKVSPSGKKTFVLKYRTTEGGRGAQQRWFRIGHYGSITLEDARKQAMCLRAEVVEGNDPQRQRQTLRDATTMTDLWERFPAKDGTGVDAVKAGAVLMADCYAAGEMLPPDEARIRKPGRPRKVAA